MFYRVCSRPWSILLWVLAFTYSTAVNCDLNFLQTLKDQKGFRIEHLSITSLTKYIGQLRFYLHDDTLISINESLLDDNVDESQIKVVGYDIVRNDRNWEGGGVAIYYRDYLNVKIRDDLTIPNLEAICLEVNKFKCKPLLVASIYRPLALKLNCLIKFTIL